MYWFINFGRVMLWHELCYQVGDACCNFQWYTCKSNLQRLQRVDNRWNNKFQTQNVINIIQQGRHNSEKCTLCWVSYSRRSPVGLWEYAKEEIRCACRDWWRWNFYRSKIFAQEFNVPIVGFARHYRQRSLWYRFDHWLRYCIEHNYKCCG